MNYLFVSGILLVLSIAVFFIRNRTTRLTLRGIIRRGSYPGTKPWNLNNYPGIILMFGVVTFIICSPLSPLITFLVGILAIFFQRLIIWTLLQILARLRIQCSVGLFFLQIKGRLPLLNDPDNNFGLLKPEFKITSICWIHPGNVSK